MVGWSVTLVQIEGKGVLGAGKPETPQFLLVRMLLIPLPEKPLLVQTAD